MTMMQHCYNALCSAAGTGNFATVSDQWVDTLRTFRPTHLAADMRPLVMAWHLALKTPKAPDMRDALKDAFNRHYIGNPDITHTTQRWAKGQLKQLLALEHRPQRWENRLRAVAATYAETPQVYMHLIRQAQTSLPLHREGKIGRKYLERALERDMKFSNQFSTPKTRPDATMVMLWTGPRFKSTLISTSFMALPHVSYRHEPIGDAYYCGPHRISDVQINNPDLVPQTHEAIAWAMLRTASPQHVTMAKDMAYALESHLARHWVGGWNNMFKNRSMDAFLRHGRHGFLLREPIAAMISLKKCSENPVTGWDRFHASESGFRQVYELHAWLGEMGLSTPVVDTDAVCNAPASMLPLLCAQLGLEYHPCMLAWQAGRRAIYDKWPGWHDDVQESTGFRPARAVVKDGMPQLDREMMAAITRATPYYEALHREAISFPA